MKLLFTFLVAAISISSTCNRTGDNCKGKPQKDMMCAEIYKPVCGCDNKTYGNECDAKRAGIKKWKEGECATQP